jgi:hypothetical protein
VLKHHPDCRFTPNHKGTCFAGRSGLLKGWPKDEDCKHNSRIYPPMAKGHTGPVIWHCNDCAATNEPQVDGPSLETLGDYMDKYRRDHTSRDVEERLDSYKDLLMNIVLESNKLVAKLSKRWKEGDGAYLIDMLQVATTMLDADAEDEDDDFIMSEMEGDDETTEVTLTPSRQDIQSWMLGTCDNLTHVDTPHEFSQTCRGWERVYPKVLALPASTAKVGYCMSVDCPPTAHVEGRKCNNFIERDVMVSEVEQKRRQVTKLEGFNWEPDEAVEFSPGKDHQYETQ